MKEIVVGTPGVHRGLRVLGTYATCAKCGYKFQLPFKARSQVPPIYFARCPKCGFVNVISPAEVEEKDVHHFNCPVCGKSLFVEGELPVKVKCPLCGSVLEVKADGVNVLSAGERPKVIPVMSLLGALLKLESPLLGALIGFFAGVVLENLMKMESEAILLESENSRHSHQ